jgi:parvulin-like peptidyl-prolyl isomerase
MFVVAALVAVPVVHAEDKGADERKKLRILDRIVASVNDTVILNSELLERVAPYRVELARIPDEAERKRQEGKVKSRALQDLIDEELVLQAALESKIEVTEKEIQNAVKELQRQNNLDEEQFAAALKAQGQSMASLQSDLRRQFMRMRAVQMLVRPKVNVTDEDVQARWQSQKASPNAINKVHLHHILIALPPTPSETELAAARKRAAELIEKARAEKNFVELAKKESDDPLTKASGGDLGWLERGSVATEWEDVVFAMNKGEVRGPVAGPRGLYVFYVADVERGKNTDALDDKGKEQIRNALTREETEKQTKLWLEDLRKKAHIQNKL